MSSVRVISLHGTQAPGRVPTMARDRSLGGQLRRVGKVFLIMALFYIAPLAGNLKVLVDPRLVFVVIACAMILLTQPELSTRDARASRCRDRFSVVVIFIAALLSQVTVVVEWAYGSASATNLWFVIPGITMVACGTAFRVWAIRTLGRFFTATVTVQDNHKVITTGPYRSIRHPSYLGAGVAFIGSGVILQAWVGILVTIAVMGAAYAYRIYVEELSPCG